MIFIVRSSRGLLKESLYILLEACPVDLDIKEIKNDIEGIVTEADLHHIHVWEIQPGKRMMTVHIRIGDYLLSKIDQILQTIHSRLNDKWNISHAVLEPEFEGCGTNEL